MLKKDEQEEKEKSVLETIKTNEFLIPINSVHDFIEAIQSFTHGENGYNSSASDNNNDGELNFTIPPLDTGETLFFRGEATLFSSSSPSVFRNKKLFDNEKKVTIEAISGGARELGNENTNFNIISKIQHHKGITRMLDVTTNALTSLFFACGTSNDDGQMGSVQVFIGSSEKHKKRALETYLSKVVFTDENMDLLEQLYSKSKNSNSKEADNFDEWLEKKTLDQILKCFRVILQNYYQLSHC